MSALFEHCDMNISHCIAGSSAGNSVGVVVGGFLGGIVLIVLLFVALTMFASIVYRNCNKTTNQSAPIRVNYTTGYPTMSSSRLGYPQQPSAVPFNLTQPGEEPVTQTQPTDSDFTKAPPPAYGLHENFTEYKETLPPSYSEERNNFSQPLPTQPPPSYTDCQA